MGNCGYDPYKWRYPKREKEKTIYLQKCNFFVGDTDVFSQDGVIFWQDSAS